MEITASYKYDSMLHIEFKFKNKKAIAIMLEDEKKRNGKTILKTEYFGAFQDLQNYLVKRGYTLIFIENRNRWGTPNEIEDQYEFIQYASKELNVSNKVITIGMSCGGMMSIHLAAKHPECIEGLYLDAPVLNYLSCPGRMGIAYDVTDGMWEEFERAWKMTKSELLTFREHPLDKLNVLVENKIPVYMAYGDSDNTVPYTENGIVLENIYLEKGLKSCLFIDKKVGVDHHPHGPTSEEAVYNFFNK